MGNIYGARGGTRTPTVFLPSGPKPGASTNFATRAGYQIVTGGLLLQTTRLKSVSTLNSTSLFAQILILTV